MPRIVIGTIFFFVASLVVILLHRYLWLRLVRDTDLPRRVNRIFTWLLLVVATSLPLSFILVRTVSPTINRVVTLPIYLWMGLSFLLFAFLFTFDLLRLVGRVRPRQPRASRSVVDLDRRRFIARAAAITATTGAFGSGAYGTRNGFCRVETKRLRIPLARLPRGMDHFTIVQLTDLHLGPTLGRAWLEQIIGRVNALKPHLIAITGDLVDGSVPQLQQTVQPLSWLKAEHGVHFVTGNHEYYSGAPQWVDELTRLGLSVLQNQRLPVGEGKIAFDLVGINDHHAERMLPGQGPNLCQALSGRDPTRALILLAHQPKAVIEAARYKVDLQLSGHTHGGQIWPMKYLVRLQQPYISGLVNHQGCQLYISEGTGFWGPPMRIGTTSEITHITLRSG